MYVLEIHADGQEAEVEILRLRPHHLLCIPNFEGRGYSSKFICNLGEIKKRIEGNDIRIRIVDGQDDVCVKCPNVAPCRLMKYPSLLDKRTSCVLGLDYGKVYDASQLFALVRRRISVELLHIICRDCAFYNQCKELFEKNFLHEKDMGAI